MLVCFSSMQVSTTNRSTLFTLAYSTVLNPVISFTGLYRSEVAVSVAAYCGGKNFSEKKVNFQQLGPVIHLHWVQNRPASGLGANDRIANRVEAGANPTRQRICFPVQPTLGPTYHRTSNYFAILLRTRTFQRSFVGLLWHSLSSFSLLSKCFVIFPLFHTVFHVFTYFSLVHSIFFLAVDG